jgi:hypothetical protein
VWGDARSIVYVARLAMMGRIRLAGQHASFALITDRRRGVWCCSRLQELKDHRDDG